MAIFHLVLSSVPGPVSNVVLTFDSSSVVNADNGMVSVSAQISWTASSMPNGNITGHSVIFIRDSTGSMVLSIDSLAPTAVNHTVTITLIPNEMYFATVQIINGAGVNNASSPIVQSPQGSKI